MRHHKCATRSWLYEVCLFLCICSLNDVILHCCHNRRPLHLKEFLALRAAELIASGLPSPRSTRGQTFFSQINFECAMLDHNSEPCLTVKAAKLEFRSCAQLVLEKGFGCLCFDIISESTQRR
jgi:hypothetical protein